MKPLSGLVFLSASLLLTSCVAEVSDYPEVSLKGESCVLNIEVATSLPSTRAAGQPMNRGTVEENFINLQDYAVFVLDASDADNPTVIERLVIDDVKEIAVGRYLLVGTFSYPQEVHPIQLAVLANCGGDFRGNYNALMSGSTTLQSLYTNLTSFEFSMPVARENNLSVAWEPVVNADAQIPGDSKGIPMFGLSNVMRPDGSPSSYIPPINVEIPMLRSLAKIIVVDKTDEDTDLIIQQATLKFYNERGRFIPDGSLRENMDWFLESKQVALPSLPAANSLHSYPVRLRHEEQSGSFYAYLPEMDLPANMESQRPMIAVTVMINGEAREYEFPIGNYDDNGGFLPDSDFSILRNHRYTFGVKVRELTQQDVDLIIEVVDDWDYIHDMELE